MAKYTLLTKEIREAIEKMYDSGVYTFGVRAMTRKPSGERVMVRPGDDVENSYAAYDDVEPRELGGASSVGFSVDFGKVEDEDHFNEIIERVAREYAEDEDQIAIIAGRHNLDDENNDMGETLISSPTVVSVVGDARGILAKKPIGSASESGSALPSLLLGGAVEKLGGTHAERMARAAEQGYVTDFLHGSPTLRESGAIDINYPNRTDAGYLGKAFYGTGPDNRFIAKAYAGNTGTVLDLKTNANRFKDFTYDENYRANIEEFGRSIGVETPMTSEDWPTIFAAKMQEAGYDGARGLADDGSVVELAIYDPSKVRSINADFNPANRDSSNLLAGIQSAAPIGAGALLAGAALAPEDAEAGVITKGGKRLIEAWHGSPHSFDKFDISKIGTGEGAQAYGHGLYFADAKETAKEYRDALANKNLFQANTENGYAAARAAGLDAGFADDAVKYIQLGVKDFDEFRRTQKKVWGKDIPESARLVFDTILKSANDGFLYRTHIDVDPDTLLDWDRPLSEQSEAVQRIFYDPTKPNSWHDKTGMEAYVLLGRRFGNPSSDAKETAQFFKSKGIPGIRYRDQMSRGDTAEPTFNYVMFDDKPISIVERGNASPEALAATAAAATAAAALNNFQSRRASKRDYWRQMRQEITDFASAVAGGAFAALDKPLQGYMGLAGVAGTLAAGGTLPQALQQGARIASQPSEATAYQYGGAMTDALAPYSPQGAAIAGALTNAGIQLTSPF